MVVIGGTFWYIQILVSVRQIFYRDFKRISSVYNQSQQLEFNLQLKPSRFKTIKSKFKSGIQQVNKDSGL